jgi:hypothetical protein
VAEIEADRLPDGRMIWKEGVGSEVDEIQAEADMIRTDKLRDVVGMQKKIVERRTRRSRAYERRERGETDHSPGVG